MLLQIKPGGDRSRSSTDNTAPSTATRDDYNVCSDLKSFEVTDCFIHPNPRVDGRRPDAQYRLELPAALLVAPRLVDYPQYVQEEVDYVEVELQSAHDVVIRVELHPVACTTKTVRGCSPSCPQGTNLLLRKTIWAS